MPDRLKLEAITIEITQTNNTKIIIFRNDRSDTPHLTISFGNFSKEIDLHLTTRTENGEDYVNIAKINESDIVDLANCFVAAFLQYGINNFHKLKKIRPGWLKRKRYLIYFLDNNSQSYLVERIAPYKKYHGKEQRIFKRLAFLRVFYSSEAQSRIFCPSTLHYIAQIGCNMPIFAFRECGTHKPEIIPIGLIKGLNGVSTWRRLDRFTAGMKDVLETLFADTFKRILPQDAWSKIYNQLHLEDFGLPESS